MPIANTVLLTSKFVNKVDLMLSILSTSKKQTNKNTKGHKKTMESVGYVYYLDCNDGIMAVCLRPNYKLKILHMWCSLYINYTSLTLSFFKKGISRTR